MNPAVRQIILTPPFSPSKLFRNGESGLWLDPSDAATGYQESTGVTAGAVNSPTGLRLDKRLGLVLGPEKFTSGTGATVDGWTYPGGAGGSVAAVGGAVTLTCATVLSAFADRIAHTPVAGLTVGKYYEVTANLRNISDAVGARLSVADTEMTADGGGTFVTTASASLAPVRLVFAATATTMYVRLIALAGSSLTQVSANAISVKLLDGNHVLMSTAAARPTWKLDGAIYSELLDGADDGYATAAFSAGTLTSNMDCFIAVKRNSAADTIPCSFDSGTGHFAKMASGSATSATGAAAGTPTYFVDSTQVTGGAAVTAGDLHTAMTVGAWHILEVRGLDLSAWTAFRVSLYTAQMLNGNIGGVILCPAQTDSRRAQIRRWLGNKVGLSL